VEDRYEECGAGLSKIAGPGGGGGGHVRGRLWEGGRRRRYWKVKELGDGKGGACIRGALGKLVCRIRVG